MPDFSPNPDARRQRWRVVRSTVVSFAG